MHQAASPASIGGPAATCSSASSLRSHLVSSTWQGHAVPLLPLSAVAALMFVSFGSSHGRSRSLFALSRAMPRSSVAPIAFFFPFSPMQGCRFAVLLFLR